MKVKVSTLISAFWPGCTKPMSRFETMASISSWLSCGTSTSKACADHAADGMDGELLHHSIHRCGKRLELGALLGLGHVLDKPGRLCLGLVELVEQGAAEFRDGLRAGLDDRGDGRFGFLQLALLHPEILLLLDQQLERLEVLQLRAEFAVVERPADADF